MPCYKPLKAYHAPGGISFNRKESFGIPIDLPCGRCIGCRIEKTQAWALRITHEAQMHEDNCFLTLTYDDYHLPPHNSLRKSDFQKFIRALRQKTKLKIRYYMCGEYGSQCQKHQTKDCMECGPLQRPHYHAILFGYDFPDKTYWRERKEIKIYRSAELENTWHHGNTEIGNVTFKSAGYVARYIMKKLNGELAEQHYKSCLPEYTQMSLRPGIGETWYRKFKSDIFPDDFCVRPDGRKMPVPTYYRVLLEREDPKLHEQLKKVRVEKARTNPDNTYDRLAVREICQTKKAERLTRSL